VCAGSVPAADIFIVPPFHSSHTLFLGGFGLESKFLALLVRQNQIMLEIQIAVMLGSGFEKDTLEPLIAAVENTRVLVREIMKEEFEPKPLGDFS